MATIRFDPPKTVGQFMISEAFFRLIAGPIGSAKTTGCIFELLRRAAQQAPAPDGIRYTRFAIVRQTLAQLKMTILKDVLQWLPGIASWKVSDSTVYIELGDIRSEWIFIPLEDAIDQRRLLSSQLTGAWLSECIEMDVDLIAPLAGRCGRYPNAIMGGCTWYGIIADTNMPEEGSTWHKLMENPPSIWQVFKQPGGLTELAENLPWLFQTVETLKLAEDDPVRLAKGRQYYELAAQANSPAWVIRYVHAQYGPDPTGSVVFAATFRRDFHVVPQLVPVEGQLLIIGQDFGRDPCSIICQMDHMGRLLVLEEVPADDIGLEIHLRHHLRPRLMQPRYLGKAIAVVGDPSGIAKDSLYEVTSFDCLKANGFHAFPAPTNDLDPRLRAVEYFLMMNVGGRPGIVFDELRCPQLVIAMNSGYRFSKDKNKENQSKPNKNNYSHLADALQYACLVANGGAMNQISRRFTRPPRQQRPSSGGWT